MPTHAKIVDAWFRETIATGEIARHTPAYNHAFAAKADLIARLDTAAPAQIAAGQAIDYAAIVSCWHQEQLAAGEVALHGPALDQAVAARSDLIARLSGVADVAAPAKKGPRRSKAAGKGRKTSTQADSPTEPASAVPNNPEPAAAAAPED